MFGSTMQNDLDSAGRGVKNPTIANGKRQQVMAKWLGIEAQYKAPAVTKGQAKAVDSASAAGTVAL